MAFSSLTRRSVTSEGTLTSRTKVQAVTGVNSDIFSPFVLFLILLFLIDDTKKARDALLFLKESCYFLSPVSRLGL